MRAGKRIAVVVPAHNEETQITRVVETMPEWVDELLVVDDCSPDRTREVVHGLLEDHPRLRLIEHHENAGVGAAIGTGYRRALELHADVIAVMAGDGQMPPDELASIVDPVLDGSADYAKANRLASGEAWNVIPRKRYLGNAVLTFLTKIASGYYGVTDSQTGFTAIDARVLAQLDLDDMYPRYGYPNDMLVKLNVLRARVRDVPTRPVYDVGEKSGLKIYRVVFTIGWLLVKRFWWRMGMRYVIRDFHPLFLFFLLGIPLLGLGMAGGVALLVLLCAGSHPTGPTAVLDSLAISSGLLLTLFGMLFDFEYNQPLNPE